MRCPKSFTGGPVTIADLFACQVLRFASMKVKAGSPFGAGGDKYDNVMAQ
jgi:hypothetical protein